MRSLTFLFCSLLLYSQRVKPQQQIPLGTGKQESTHLEGHWKYNFSSPSPHIFSSVDGLLQQWSNTFFPVGHSIVPCTVPPFTNLYHGREDGEMPENPEWVAFDVEMSYGIMGSGRDSHILTYQTTKQIGCLYFDGESATLFGSGMMDAQMLFIYGNVTGPHFDDDRRFRGLEDEYDRASGLCQWVQNKGLGGFGWGVEGIVRMNAGFEMIWCNFTSPSIRLLTKTNVTAPLLRAVDQDHPLILEGSEVGARERKEMMSTSRYSHTSAGYYPLPTESSPPDRSKDPDQPPMPPNWRSSNQEPFLASQAWGWFESAIWHYGSTGMGAGRGESRVKPITCGFMTFYNPVFQEQQLERAITERQKLNLTKEGHWEGPGVPENRIAALEQLMRRKRYHSLRNVSASDARIMNDAAERVLKRQGFDNTKNSGAHQFANNNCTGIDWTEVTHDIVQRYARRLRQLSSIFDMQSKIDMKNATALRSWFMGLRQHTHYLLMPYFKYPTELVDLEGMSSLRQQTLSRCQYQYTRLLAPDVNASPINPEEAVVMSAVEETLGNICLWVVNAGVAIEWEWLERIDGNTARLSTKFSSSLIERINSWRNGLEELMAWLGWVDQWTYCKDGCAEDEVCFIPMWPMDNIDQPGRRTGPGYGGGHGYGYRRPGRRYPGDGGKDDVDKRPPKKRPEGPPNWSTNEKSLWEPKCIKAEYAI